LVSNRDNVIEAREISLGASAASIYTRHVEDDDGQLLQIMAKSFKLLFSSNIILKSFFEVPEGSLEGSLGRRSNIIHLLLRDM
jgi:hypothetical protein